MLLIRIAKLKWISTSWDLMSTQDQPSDFDNLMTQVTSPILIELEERWEGKRLYLRPMKAGDGEIFLNVLKENEDHLMEVVQEVKSIKTVEKSEIRNRVLYANWMERKRFVMGIFDMDNDELIGEMWLEPIDWKIPAVEIGYFIVKSYEGKGYVTEAVKVAMKLLFEGLKIEKAEIHTDSTNPKSYAVAERLQFTKEAILRKREKKADGIFVDRIYYGLTKEEYVANKDTIYLINK